MKYQKPLDAQDENALYVDGNPAAEIEASAVGAKAIEHPMREIVHCIEQAGLTPCENDLTQLWQAITTRVKKEVPLENGVIPDAFKLFVRKDGNDDNDGITDSTSGACLTINGALSKIFDYSLRGRNVCIIIHEGTYEECVVIDDSFAAAGVGQFNASHQGQTRGISVPIQLRGANGDNVVIKAPLGPSNQYSSVSAVTVRSAYVLLDNITIMGNGTNYCLCLSGYKSTIVCGRLILDTAFTGTPEHPLCHIFLEDNALLRGFYYKEGSDEAVYADLTFRNKCFHLVALGMQSMAYLSLATIRFNAVVVNSAFQSYHSGNVIELDRVTWSGSFTGRRFQIARHGLIYTAGAGVNFIPGTVAGTIDTASGGIYA